MLDLIKNLLAIIVIGISLSACSAVTLPQVFGSLGWFAVDSVVEAETGKNVTDNVVSGVTGKDCALKKVFKDGETVCKEKEKK